MFTLVGTIIIFTLCCANVKIASGFVTDINQLKVVNLKTDSESDKKCQSNLNYFTSALERREYWALEMFDTWAKVQSGILQGNSKNFGHFTACVEFRHEPEDLNVDKLQGQHCMVTYRTKENSTILPPSDNVFDWPEVGSLVKLFQLTISSGICVPAVCSVDNVIEFASELLSSANLEVESVSCKTNDSVAFTAIDVIAIIIFSTFGLMLILSTTYDVLMQYQEKETCKLYIAFSVYTNGEKLFDITRSKSKHSIDCLNGLRAIALMWIILGHRMLDRTFIHISTTNANEKEFEEWMETLPSVFIASFHIWVDTFFVMGGLLVTWSLLKSLDSKNVNIPRMYFHRYIRYTPVLAALILFTVSLMKFMGNGPLFDFEMNASLCKTNWYWALLHIQNYVVPSEQCLDFSWYLSVDFQMFILSPLLIYPAWRWGWKKFMWTFPLLIILSAACNFATAYKYELPPSVGRLSLESIHLYDRLIYFPTHTRYGPWLIGMIIGYILYNTKYKKIEINKIYNAIMWILVLSLMIAIVLGYFPFQLITNNNTTRAGNALYLATFRIGWGIGIAWIIFACHNGSGGIIRWFLSLPQWQPIGRMGLSIYLVHRIYQMVSMLPQKVPAYFDFVTVMHIFWGEVLITVALASILYLTFEAPLLLVENYFYNKRQESKKK